ncbi:MAG: tetraacyldisaccharide 4'-kinase [Tannerellaceae bacterium]|jgi:tetraacyldisaccharide 4'-kinase|nr:tetraacyldisaccharide 4'-kinase [Tannerellaceae bacterium]
MSSDSEIKFNYLLAPLSFLYGLGVKIRNKLFDLGILPCEQFPVPVICVGNLAAGGTGKTPHTEYIIRLLLHRRYKIAVLSRGYKRKTTGYILAESHHTSREIGDEPFQIRSKFPDITLAVDADRRRGIRNLLRLPEDKRPEVILLDDGFQHRYVKPSFSIILTDFHRKFSSDKLLPVGLLREPAEAVRRADVVIVTKCEKDMKPIEYRIMEEDMHLLAHQQVFFSRVVYSDLKPLFPGVAGLRVLRDIRRNDDVLVISAIANPAPLEDEIKRYSKKVHCASFPDHHDFDRKDFEELANLFDAMASSEKLIVVTEKDAARIRHNPLLPEKWKETIYYLPISIVFHGKREGFDEILIKHIETIRLKGFTE